MNKITINSSLKVNSTAEPTSGALGFEWIDISDKRTTYSTQDTDIVTLIKKYFNLDTELSEERLQELCTSHNQSVTIKKLFKLMDSVLIDIDGIESSGLLAKSNGQSIQEVTSSLNDTIKQAILDSEYPEMAFLSEYFYLEYIQTEELLSNRGYTSIPEPMQSTIYESTFDMTEDVENMLYTIAVNEFMTGLGCTKIGAMIGEVDPSPLDLYKTKMYKNLYDELSKIEDVTTKMNYIASILSNVVDTWSREHPEYGSVLQDQVIQSEFEHVYITGGIYSETPFMPTMSDFYFITFDLYNV